MKSGDVQNQSDMVSQKLGVIQQEESKIRIGCEIRSPF